MNAQRWQEKKVNLPASVKVAEPQSLLDGVANAVVAVMLYAFARLLFASLSVDFGPDYGIVLACLAAVAAASTIYKVVGGVGGAGDAGTLPLPLALLVHCTLLLFFLVTLALSSLNADGSELQAPGFDPHEVLPTGRGRMRDQRLLGGLRVLWVTFMESRVSGVLACAEFGLLIAIAVAYVIAGEQLRADSPLATRAREKYHRRIFGANRLALQGKLVSPDDDDLESVVTSLAESFSRRSLLSERSEVPGRFSYGARLGAGGHDGIDEDGASVAGSVRLGSPDAHGNGQSTSPSLQVHGIAALQGRDTRRMSRRHLTSLKQQARAAKQNRLQRRMSRRMSTRSQASHVSVAQRVYQQTGMDVSDMMSAIQAYRDGSRETMRARRAKLSGADAEKEDDDGGSATDSRAAPALRALGSRRRLSQASTRSSAGSGQGAGPIRGTQGAGSGEEEGMGNQGDRVDDDEDDDDEEHYLAGAAELEEAGAILEGLRQVLENENERKAEAVRIHGVLAMQAAAGVTGDAADGDGASSAGGNGREDKSGRGSEHSSSSRFGAVNPLVLAARARATGGGKKGSGKTMVGRSASMRAGLGAGAGRGPGLLPPADALHGGGMSEDPELNDAEETVLLMARRLIEARMERVGEGWKRKGGGSPGGGVVGRIGAAADDAAAGAGATGAGRAAAWRGRAAQSSRVLGSGSSQLRLGGASPAYGRGMRALGALGVLVRGGIVGGGALSAYRAKAGARALGLGLGIGAGARKAGKPSASGNNSGN